MALKYVRPKYGYLKHNLGSGARFIDFKTSEIVFYVKLNDEKIALLSFGSINYPNRPWHWSVDKYVKTYFLNRSLKYIQINTRGREVFFPWLNERYIIINGIVPKRIYEGVVIFEGEYITTFSLLPKERRKRVIYGLIEKGEIPTEIKGKASLIKLGGPEVTPTVKGNFKFVYNYDVEGSLPVLTFDVPGDLREYIEINMHDENFFIKFTTINESIKMSISRIREFITHVFILKVDPPETIEDMKRALTNIGLTEVEIITFEGKMKMLRLKTEKSLK